MLKRSFGALVALALVSSAAFAQAPANSPRALTQAALFAKIKSDAAAATGTVVDPVTGLIQFGQKVQAFTLADLQAASADAKAQNPPDTRHAPCWDALATVVSNQNLNGILPSGLGAAQLIQKSFDLQSTFEGHQAWKDQIATACALTLTDVASDLNTLLAKAGLSAVNTAIVIPKL